MTMAIIVALVFCLAIILVAAEGGLLRWVLRGGPDYLDEPDEAKSDDAVIAAAMAFRADHGWPQGRDMQQGWPRDTGTKP